MAFDFSTLSPVPANWFRTKFRYRGMGTAHFENPQGWVRGKTEIRVNETGRFSIEMEIENFNIEDVDPIDDCWDASDKLYWLTTGVRPQIKGALHLRVLAEPRNTCIKLSVRTGRGMVEVLDCPIFYQTNGNLGVKFSASECRFAKPSGTKAKFWVMPLSNFPVLPVIHPHALRDHPFFRHPLRMHRVPALPEGLSGEDLRRASFVAHGHDNLIVFKRGHSYVYIEPLPDFAQRRKKLVEHRSNSLITAVMVGRIGNKPTNLQEAIVVTP